jgi:hypothetical protein
LVAINLKLLIMKNLRIVLGCLLLTVAVVGFSSFASKNYKKGAFARVCFSYIATKNRVAKGQTDSIDPAELVLTSKWSSSVSTEPPTDCGGTVRLCKICFDNSAITLQDAIDAANDYYSGTLFTDGVQITPTGNVRVYLKN